MSTYNLTPEKKKEEIAICEKIMKDVLPLMDDPSKWKEDKGFDGVTVRHCSAEGTPLQVAYGETIINVPLDKALEYADTYKILIPKDRKEEESEGFLWRTPLYEDADCVVHQSVVDSGTAIVKNRESVNFSYKVPRTETRSITVHTTQGLEDVGERVKGTVRMKVMFYLVVWEKVDDTHTRIRMCIHSDPAGMVPAGIYNSVMKKQLQLCSRMKKGAEEYAKAK